MPPLPLDQLPVHDRRVLVRTDLNVPFKDGQVADDTRIRASLPTLRNLLDRGAAVIVMSHLGRPQGAVVPELRLDPVAHRLCELLGQPVKKLDDCLGGAVTSAVASSKPGDVVLLENLRFHKGETKNDPEFARSLAALADAYVNDAFGTCHRKHASVVGIADLLPSAEGLLVARERHALDRLVNHPARPYVAVLGGAKVADKITVVRSLLERVDALLVGGAMAYTFLNAAGHSIGASLLDREHLGDVAELLKEDRAGAKKLHLPVDHVVVASGNGKASETDGADIPDGSSGIDIGPRTVRAFSDLLASAATIFTNGPLGKFEEQPFDAGTKAILQAIADSKAFSVIGGGDSIAAVHQAGVADRIGHLCTGGGASMEYLTGNPLPGLVALETAAAQTRG